MKQMNLSNTSGLVTGGASGLGKASAIALANRGMKVVIADLPESPGGEVADSLGNKAVFVACDVTDPKQVENAVAEAEKLGTFRSLIHCAGRGGPIRVVDRDGNPGNLADFVRVINLNLVGSFSVMSISAAAMARNEPVNGERGACVLTASIAAFEGQIGQISYAAAKAGIVGMTLVGARDLSKRMIRVNTIAPGIMDTPALARLTDEVRESLAASIPHPSRLGHPEEFAQLAVHILENAMLNGETIRLDGAIRMAPR